MGADIFRLACFAVAVSAAAMTVRAYKPELGQQAAIAAAALVLLYAVKSMGGVFETLRGLLNEYGVPSEFLSLLIKLTGIVYMAQFAADLCRDAGESAIAGHHKNKVAAACHGGKGALARKVTYNYAVGGVIKLLKKLAEKYRHRKSDHVAPD